MSDLSNPLLAEKSGVANALEAEARTDITGYVGDENATTKEGLRYGEAIDAGATFEAANSALGVTEEQWGAFVEEVNAIKAQMNAFEGNEARVMQNRSVGDAQADRRIAVLMYRGMSQEEAEAEVYGSEEYQTRQAQFAEYEELNNRLGDLYESVGLDRTGSIGDGRGGQKGVKIDFNLDTGEVTKTEVGAFGFDIGKSLVLAAAGIVAGPAIASALGGVLGPAAAKAASSAIWSTASQYMANGEVDWGKALISAATAYGGAKLGDALANSDSLGGITDKISGVTDKFSDAFEGITNGNEVIQAAIKAGGMSAVSQLVMTGELDMKEAAIAALMGGGSQMFSEWVDSMNAAGAEEDFLEELAEMEEFQQAAIDADLKDPFLNPNYETVGDGLMVNAAGEVFNYAGESMGSMDDLDLDGDGMLSGNDLQNIEVPDREYVDERPFDNEDIYDQYAYGGTHPETTIEYDENGNPYVARRDVFWKDGDDQNLYFEDGTIAATNNGDGTWTFGEGENAPVGKLSDFGFESDSGPIDFALEGRQEILAGSEKVFYDPDTNSFYNSDEAALYGMDTTDSETGYWLVRGEDGKVYVTNGYDIREYRGGINDDPTMNDGVEDDFRNRDPIWQHANNGGEAPDSPPDQTSDEYEFPEPTPETPPAEEPVEQPSDDDSAANADPNDNVNAGEGPAGGGPTSDTGGQGSSGPSGGGGTEGGGTDAGSNLPDFTLPPWLNEFLDNIDAGTDSEVPVNSDGTGLGGTGGDTGGTDQGDGTGGVGGGDESGSGDDSGPDVGDGTGTGEGGSGGGSGDSGDTPGGEGTGDGLGDGGGAGEGTGGGENDGDGTGGSEGVGVGSGTEPGAGGGAGGGGLGGDGSGSGGLLSSRNNEWGELFGYSPFKVYEPTDSRSGRGLEPVKGLLKGYLS